MGTARKGDLVIVEQVHCDELVSTSAIPMRHQRCYVASAADVNVDATMRAAKAHHWTDHPGQPKDFDSLADVRAILVR